jgi:hypothetical protein
MDAVLTDNVMERRRLAAADEMWVEGHHHEATVLSLDRQTDSFTIRSHN